MLEWLDRQQEQPPPWMSQAERDTLRRARATSWSTSSGGAHVHRMEQSAETAVQIHFSAVGNRTNDIMRR